jgi:hypothetical protein
VRTSPRNRRGSFLILTAVTLAVAAACVGFSLDASRVYLNWRSLKIEAEAAALAAVLELDGSAEGLARARQVAAEIAGRNKCSATIEFQSDSSGPWDSEGKAAIARVRIRLARPAALGWIRIAVNSAPPEVRTVAVAEQRPIDPPGPAQPARVVTAADPNAPDFGFQPGLRYEVTAGPGTAPAPPGQLTAVRVLSGAPKHREIGWAAFQFSEDGEPGGIFAGAFLQGSNRTGARPAGYYAAALVR